MLEAPWRSLCLYSRVLFSISSQIHVISWTFYEIGWTEKCRPEEKCSKIIYRVVGEADAEVAA